MGITITLKVLLEDRHFLALKKNIPLQTYRII